MNLRSNKRKKESTLLKNILARAGGILETVFVPFGKQFKLAENLELTKRQYQESTKGILDARKPKRPPRFFFKSKYLIPYSSMKAKLQMTIDVRNIELGVRTTPLRAFI